MSDENARAHAFISGTVQGVFYRANTQKQARRRDLDGWVKNLDDGRVEAVFEGPRAKVEDILDWCHDGSPQAEVDDVDVTWEDPEGLDGFEIRY